MEAKGETANESYTGEELEELRLWLATKNMEMSSAQLK